MTVRRASIGMVKCKECGEKKERIHTDKRNSSGTVFEAPDGRQWYGLLCPDCRYQPKQKVEEVQESRRCRLCSSRLPISRYFECEVCRPVLGRDYGDCLYL